MEYLSLKTATGFLRVFSDEISYLLYEEGIHFLYLKNGEKLKLLLDHNKRHQILMNKNFFLIHQYCIFNINQRFEFCTKAKKINLPNKKKLNVSRNGCIKLNKLLNSQ